MARYRLAAAASARIRAILDESAERFGPGARDRYATLILQAMQDVADEPRRPAARQDPAVDRRAWFYHIRHSRTRAAGRVGRPRHILVYDVATDGVVEIIGLIPDMVPSDIALSRLTDDR